MTDRPTTRAASVGLVAVLVGLLLGAGTAPAVAIGSARPVRATGATTSSTGADAVDRIRPSLAGRPGWLVVRRAVAAMQGAQRVAGVLTFSGDLPYEVTGTLDPANANALVTYHHVDDGRGADPADSLPMDLRLTASTAYRRLDEGSKRNLLADWYSFDLTAADPRSTPTEVLVAQWFVDAPLCGLDVDTWSELAATTVGGVTTRHFRGTAALRDAVQLLGESKGFLPRLSLDLWVDGRGAIRRVRWVAAPDPAYKGAKKAPRVTLDATYRPLGSPLVVTKPSGRIVDFSQLYQ